MHVSYPIVWEAFQHKEQMNIIYPHARARARAHGQRKDGHELMDNCSTTTGDAEKRR